MLAGYISNLNSDFDYDADGNEILPADSAEKRDFLYNADGDEVDAEGNLIKRGGKS
jgi:hypothetical protein